MRYCDRHWLMMERAVADAGLGEFSTSYRDRFERLVSVIYGFHIVEPDALVSLHGELTQSILSEVGPGLFNMSRGHLCPLCHVLEHAIVDPGTPLQGRAPDQYAVDLTAESTFKRFEENGVIAKRVLQ